MNTNRIWLGFLFLAPAMAPAQRSQLAADCACSSAEAIAANREGIAAHAQRRLTEASAAYSRALHAAPAREPSPGERALMLRFAPRVFTTPGEPFPLMDAAAILHPERPWIAYHFFWEDDIDFPDDNDPCDHELMWVELDESRSRVAAYYTYFHGRILKAPATSVEDAARHGGRAAVVVQWGKHGTMPVDWRELRIVPDSGDVERKEMKTGSGGTLEEYNRATWRKLSTVGREAQNSPLARGWPQKFEGSFAEFTDFSKLVDPADLLRRRDYTAVSCLNNATINRRFLRYNFSVKTEWPDALCGR